MGRKPKIEEKPLSKTTTAKLEKLKSLLGEAKKLEGQGKEAPILPPPAPEAAPVNPPPPQAALLLPYGEQSPPDCRPASLRGVSLGDILLADVDNRLSVEERKWLRKKKVNRPILFW